MSQCWENNTPGPVTTAHGFLTESKTGNPIANAKIQVTRKTSVFLGDGYKYTNYDVTTTNANGSYYIKFTPVGSGEFFLSVDIPGKYISTTSNDMILGQDNKFDFVVNKYVGLNIHLQNKSNQNKSNFWYYVIDNTCCNPQVIYGFGVSPVKIDTILKFNVPQLTPYIFQSMYFNGYATGGIFVDTSSFKTSFYIGKADTAVNVVNP
jgi:hypothetical protein